GFGVPHPGACGGIRLIRELFAPAVPTSHMEANRAHEPASMTTEQHTDFVQQLTLAHPKLLAYLRSLVGNRHDAEDILQRASVRMWQLYHTFEAGTNFGGWAGTIAYNEARNFIRTSGRGRVNFDDDLLARISERRQADLHNS